MNRKLIATTLGILVGGMAYADEGATPSGNPMPITGYHGHSDLSGRFGAGLILGEPTGVSLKYFFNETMAIDGAVGWSFQNETDFYLHSDFLWHKFDLVSVPDGRLLFYLGVGGWVKFRDDEDNGIGIRVPIGASYIFDKLPLDVFAEVGPVLELAPSTRGGFTLGVGARWWF
jgi:hypothetical protein